MQSVEKTYRRRARPARLWVVSPEPSTSSYLMQIARELADGLDAEALVVHRRADLGRLQAGSATLSPNNVRSSFGSVRDAVVALIQGLAKFRPGDRVLVATTPPLMPFTVAMAALAKGAVYTLFVRENYPETLIALKEVRPDSAFVDVISFLNRWLYKSASKILVVGADVKEVLMRKTDGLDIPITEIPNFAKL